MNASENLTEQLEKSLGIKHAVQTGPRYQEGSILPVVQSLVAKLAEACNAVGGVEKLGKNEMQKYSYVRAADIAKAIRRELFKRGVVVLADEDEPAFITVELAPDREGNKRSITECHLATHYEITDGVTSIIKTGYGVARDSGDKAIYKAKTGALKYFLRGLGLIPDEKDDPEFDEEGKPVLRRSPEEQKEFADKKIKLMKAQVATSNEEHAALLKDKLKGPITMTQVKRMWAAAKGGGWTEPEIRELLGHHGFESSKEITIGVYDEIMAEIQARHVAAE